MYQFTTCSKLFPVRLAIYFNGPTSFAKSELDATPSLFRSISPIFTFLEDIESFIDDISESILFISESISVICFLTAVVDLDFSIRTSCVDCKFVLIVVS
jgi:hypothetical protein